VDNAWAIQEAQRMADIVRDCNSIAQQDSSRWYFSPRYSIARESVHKQLPVAVRIARAMGENALAQQMLDTVDNSQFAQLDLMAPVTQLVTLLERQAEIEEKLGPEGPRMPATDFHAWVWDSAAPLWTTDPRAAVRNAATAIFDGFLPIQLGVPKDTAAESLAVAFDTTDPTPESPRLRIRGLDPGSEDYRNSQKGAQNLGLACAKLVRNVSSHTVEMHDEREAFEELAMLSRFARLVTDSDVVTASAPKTG
jgi:uncharacterized protein Ymh